MTFLLESRNERSTGRKANALTCTPRYLILDYEAVLAWD